MFSFDAHISQSKYEHVNMLINDVDIIVDGNNHKIYNNFYHHDAYKNQRQMNFMVSQLLDVGDVITFRNMYANSIYVSSGTPMTLLVYKIQ